MCVKAGYTCPFIFDSVPDQYKTQEVCNKAASHDPFMLKSYLDRYNSQKVCDKNVDDFPPALKFVPSWFVTTKMIKKLHNALITDSLRQKVMYEDLNLCEFCKYFLYDFFSPKYVDIC